MTVEEFLRFAGELGELPTSGLAGSKTPDPDLVLCEHDWLPAKVLVPDERVTGPGFVCGDCGAACVRSRNSGRIIWFEARPDDDVRIIRSIA